MDKWKHTPSEIKDLERFYATTALSLQSQGNQGVTVDALDQVLISKGLNFDELMLETNDFLDKYESEWK